MKSKTIVLLGKDGQLGWELQRTLSPLANLVCLGRGEANLSDFDLLRRRLREFKPAVIVNAAAYTAVDKAEREPEQAFLVNGSAVDVLAEQAAELDATLVHYSTDYVFDGEKAGPYVEDDIAAPLGVYGRSKLAGEQAIRERGGRHLIFRTSWVYSVHGANFPMAILRRAAEREEFEVVADTFGAPTSAGLIADVTALAVHQVLRGRADDSLQGIYHLVAAGKTSWYEYATFLIRAARARGLPLKVAPNRIYPVTSASLKSAAVRPKNSCLDASRLCRDLHIALPDWTTHVLRFVDEVHAARPV